MGAFSASVLPVLSNGIGVFQNHPFRTGPERKAFLRVGEESFRTAAGFIGREVWGGLFSV